MSAPNHTAPSPAVPDLLPIEGGDVVATADGLRVVLALDQPTARERHAVEHGALRVAQAENYVALSFGDAVTVSLCPARQTTPRGTLTVDLFDSGTRALLLRRTVRLTTVLARSLARPNGA